MSVPVVRYDLELVGSLDVTLNGLPLNGNIPSDLTADEKIFKKLTPEQRHCAICELRSLIGRLIDVHKNQAAIGR